MSDPATSSMPKARRMTRDDVLPWITTPVLVIVLVLVWQLYVSRSGISPFILPSPVSVWSQWLALLGSRTAWGHLGMTLYATLAGFAAGAGLGVGIGVSIARMRWLELTLTPFIVATQVVPKVALVPLFIVWFGFGITSKVIIAAVLAFFPVLTNTVLGVKSIETGHRDVMLSLNATRLQIFRRLELPSSLPYIMTGLEVGVVLAIIGAVVGEYLGGSSGLGAMLVSSMNAYETDLMFAVLIQLSLLGFALYFAIGALRRLLIPWHGSTKQ